MIDEVVARFLASPGMLGRLVVLFCVAVTLGAVVWLYPQEFADANRAAQANTRLDWVDRQLGGGNSVLPAQAIAIESRGRIPEGETFTVAVGKPRADWSELAIPDTLDNYMRYFLLPRRSTSDAPWIVCFACDRSAYPNAEPVWEDQEHGLAILRRPA